MESFYPLSKISLQKTTNTRQDTDECSLTTKFLLESQNIYMWSHCASCDAASNFIAKGTQKQINQWKQKKKNEKRTNLIQPWPFWHKSEQIPWIMSQFPCRLRNQICPVAGQVASESWWLPTCMSTKIHSKSAKSSVRVLWALVSRRGSPALLSSDEQRSGEVCAWMLL